jgi:acetoin utilization deacetylase AcuC-like enzyme
MYNKTLRSVYMTTGVFFHPTFSGEEWIIIGDKFRNFPRVMNRVLKLPQVKLFTPEKVSDELLLKIHTPRFVQDLKRAWYCDGALYSVGGCVEATERILEGTLENALVFTVAAGHHAERDSAWGGTYASCAGPAFQNAREKFGKKRFAILDTDRHHGNGTWDIFLNDNDVLHVCLCSWDRIETDGSKVCVNVSQSHTDEIYMEVVRKEFIPRAKAFEPDMILHNFGHDTCQGDYGDIGLSQDFFLRLTQEIKQCAREICLGRYLVLTHGGDRADVAEYIFPKIIEILAEK